MAGTTCTICLDDAVSPVSVPCGHIHCEACLIKCIEQAEDPVEAHCPTCRSPFNIVTPDLRFVPTKYHPYIQSSVRRVFLSPSATVQDLQARIDELEHQVERLQGKNSSLKSQFANSKRDVDRLMDRCEAHMKAVENYQEKERKLRKETESLCDEVHELQQEADAYKTKYQQMKEKYKLLKSCVAPAPNSASSSATKRNSTQAALDLTHAGPSNEGDSSRRLIAPIPKRPRLANGWRSTVGQMDLDEDHPQPPPPQALQPPPAPTRQIQEDLIAHDEFADGVRASSQPEPTRIRVTRRQSRPLRTGLTMVMDHLNVAHSDIDDEEKDGPSKTRGARPSETFVSAMSSISRHLSDAPSPSSSTQSNSKSRQPRRPAPFEEDVFGSASAGSSSLTLSSTSVIDVDDLPPLPRDRRLQRNPAREYIFRGRRIAP